jgi:transcriptional regulator with XRE-family HTH domain
VSARSGIERAMLNKLELGKIANPTVATLRAFAAALGRHLMLGLVFPAGISSGRGSTGDVKKHPG